MIFLLLVEDNFRLRQAMKTGLESTGLVRVIHDCDSGEAALNFCLKTFSAESSQAGAARAALMDVQLAGEMNGIQAAVAVRREFPRLPVVFYSIQDDDRYFRDFRQAGILTHYAYVRKSNYLLPAMILPLLKGRHRRTQLNRSRDRSPLAGSAPSG